jgi:hypothetical protein
MWVRIEVRGTVDEADLWPYELEVEPRTAGSILFMSIHDGREFVSVLLGLLGRGLEIVDAETLDLPAGSVKAAPSSFSPLPRGKLPRSVERCGSHRRGTRLGDR